MTDKAALAVIDMQKDYMRPRDYPHTLIDRINEKFHSSIPNGPDDCFL